MVAGVLVDNEDKSRLKTERETRGHAAKSDRGVSEESKRRTP